MNPQAAFVRNNYTLTDDIHFLLGRHNIDAGYHGELSKIDVNNDFEQPGEFFFNSNVTPDPAANFLFGNLSEMIQASGEYFNVRGKFQGAYVQDSWKATRDLTINYGVRYEPFIPWHRSLRAHGRLLPHPLGIGHAFLGVSSGASWAPVRRRSWVPIQRRLQRIRPLYA